MKKSNIIKSSIVAGLGLLVGLGGCTMDKNNDATISKALSRNLDDLSSVVCRMDKVDDNFLYSSGGEKVSAIATPPQRYKIEYLDSDNSLENTDETNKEDVQDNNSSGIIEFRLYSTNIPYRYISTTYNPRFTSGADHSIGRLTLLGQDVAVANNMYEDVKDELLSKTDELSNMIDIVEESNWNPDNDTRLAIKNYIEDLRQTISRIDTSYGQLNSTVKKIGQDNSNTIAPSYEVLNSNYMKILNHLDLRITYLKNAIATLENIRDILYVNIPGADIDDTNIDNNMMVDPDIQNQTDTNNNNNEDYSDLDTNVNQNDNDTTLNDTNEEDTNTSDENNQIGQNNENQNFNQNDTVSDNNTNISDNNPDNNDINIGNNDTNTGIDNQNNNLQNDENLNNFDQNNENGNSFNHNIDTYYPDGNIVNIDTMDPNYNSTVDTYNDGYNNNYNNTSYNNGMNNNYNGSNYVDQNTIGNNSINTDYDNAQNYNDNVHTNIDTMDQFTNIDTMQNNYNNDNINTNDNVENYTDNNFDTESNNNDSNTTNDSNINNGANSTTNNSLNDTINNTDRDIDPEFSQDMTYGN